MWCIAIVVFIVVAVFNTHATPDIAYRLNA